MKELTTYLELSKVHYECEDGRVISAWIEAPGLDALDIFDHLGDHELEQLQQAYAEAEQEYGEYLEAMKEDAAAARMEFMREEAL